jgi:hypothetical protein
VSLFLFAFAGFAPLGGLLAGWLVEIGGTELSFVVAGVTGLAAIVYAVRTAGISAPPRPAVLHGSNMPSTSG